MLEKLGLPSDGLRGERIERLLDFSSLQGITVGFSYEQLAADPINPLLAICMSTQYIHSFSDEEKIMMCKKLGLQINPTRLGRMGKLSDFSQHGRVTAFISYEQQAVDEAQLRQKADQKDALLAKRMNGPMLYDLSSKQMGRILENLHLLSDGSLLEKLERLFDICEDGRLIICILHEPYPIRF
jgi:hypothetical protein